MSKNLETRLSRRGFLKFAAATAGVFALEACGIKSSMEKKNVIPDLELDIDERGFEQALSGQINFNPLPDATEKSNLSCPNWSLGICMGKSSTSFRVVVNNSVASFMFAQADLINPTIPTNIIFVEDWPEPEPDGTYAGGFTGITPDNKEQNIVMSLKIAAYHTFKALDALKADIEEGFIGLSSRYLSEWTVHELAHAGRELKKLGANSSLGQKTHPQIYDFQKKYIDLYMKAFANGRGREALVFGMDTSLNLKLLRNNIYAEARARNILEPKFFQPKEK